VLCRSVRDLLSHRMRHETWHSLRAEFYPDFRTFGIFTLHPWPYQPPLVAIPRASLTTAWDTPHARLDWLVSRRPRPVFSAASLCPIGPAWRADISSQTSRLASERFNRREPIGPTCNDKRATGGLHGWSLQNQPEPVLESAGL
jgi:hypothetical protein